jgi:hypothetical protein
MKSVKLPSWSAWKNLMPGSKTTLHIHGVVLAPTPCDEPYLSPLRGATPLLFELKFKKSAKAGKFCPQVEVPKDADWQQKIQGAETVVLIRMTPKSAPIKVPIKTVV